MFIASTIVQCALDCTACTNPLHSLLLVQCQFWWFFTFIETPPLAHAQKINHAPDEAKENGGGDGG